LKIKYQRKGLICWNCEAQILSFGATSNYVLQSASSGHFDCVLGWSIVTNISGSSSLHHSRRV